MSVAEAKLTQTQSSAALSQQLAEKIQRGIYLGDFSIGTWLRHDALAESYGVSRTPVREALRILQERGIVEIKRNYGARVKGPSPRDMRDLADVRAELEGYAAELAAERIRDDQLDRLDAAWRGYQDAIEKFVDRPDGKRRSKLGERWVQANGDFHSVVHVAAANRQLQMAIQDVYRRQPPNIAYEAMSGDSRMLLRNVEEHERIAAAIRDHDGAAARRAMESHVRHSGDLVARWFEDQFYAQRDAS